MKSIKEKAEEYDKVVERISANKSIVDMSGRKQFEAGANYVLEQIESLIKNTSGDGEVYHYNLYLWLQKLVKELKGEEL